MDPLLKPYVRLLPKRCKVLRWMWEAGRLDEYAFCHDTELGKTSMHRLAFYRKHGWLPHGYQEVIRHTCDVPACFEVTHLVVGSQKTNVTIDSKISIPALNLAKTHCKHGHEFTPENTYYRTGKKVQRMCKTCRRISQQRWLDGRR